MWSDRRRLLAYSRFLGEQRKRQRFSLFRIMWVHTLQSLVFTNTGLA